MENQKLWQTVRLFTANASTIIQSIKTTGRGGGEEESAESISIYT
jgi:hypothetical protein